jgi:hypothetical protein
MIVPGSESINRRNPVYYRETGCRCFIRNEGCHSSRRPRLVRVSTRSVGPFERAITIGASLPGRSSAFFVRRVRADDAIGSVNADAKQAQQEDNAHHRDEQESSDRVHIHASRPTLGKDSAGFCHVSSPTVRAPLVSPRSASRHSTALVGDGGPFSVSLLVHLLIVTSPAGCACCAAIRTWARDSLTQTSPTTAGQA